MKTTAILLSYLVMMLFVAPGLEADDELVSGVDRRIEREPKYQSKPAYALLVLGAEAQSVVWIVQDGDRLYVDKNGNRDLTDDGEPATATDKRMLDTSRWDRRFLVEAWTLDDGSRVQDFHLRHWNYSKPTDRAGPGEQFGLSLTLGETIPMYAGWNALLAESPTEAKVVYFGGPVAPRLLRIKEFALGTTPARLSIGFITPRELIAAPDSKVSPAMLSIDALPASTKITAVIDWPVSENSPVLQTTHLLPKRCCYWEFYTESFQIPQRAIPGQATVTITVTPEKLPVETSKSLAERKDFPLELSRDHFEVSVINKGDKKADQPE